jgi:hypothetical protein
MIVHGAVVPHAPVLLEEIQPSLDEGRRVRKAIDALDFSGADVIVVVSPHASSAGIYERCEGSLSGFGIDDFEVESDTDAELRLALERAWGRPQIDGQLDFGIAVPLLLGLGAGHPVVAVSLPPTTGPGSSSLPDALDASTSLARALTASANELSVAVGVCVSAHASAGLSHRAPLTLVSGARDADRDLISSLEEDPASIAGLTGRLHEIGQACGVGPLAAFGQLFGGWRTEGVTYEAPYGVGYMVGQWSP